MTFDASGSRPLRPPVTVRRWGVHQADFLAEQAVAQAGAAVAARRPFFISVNPVMVHYGRCGPTKRGGWEYASTDPIWETDLAKFGCSGRIKNTTGVGCYLPISPCAKPANAARFAVLTNPHVPSWNRSNGVGDAPGGPSSVPSWIAGWPALIPFVEARQDMGFRNRSASAVDLDGLIGTILAGIERLGAADNTYVVFTSDNG